MNDGDNAIKWVCAFGAAAIFGVFIIGGIGVICQHRQAMAHIAAGHVQDQHGNWVKP